jgi:hypothetical protein
MNDVQARAKLAARRLNHVEFVHRPGESELAVELFTGLGCPVYQVDTPPYGAYVVVQLDGSPHGLNDMFVSQAEPEQLALEDALQRQIAAADSDLKAASAQFRRLQKERPFRSTHVGLRVPDIGAFDDVVAKLGALAAGRLAGRLDLGEVFTRTAEEAQAMSAPLKQVWIWTDVISTGLLSVGQQIELQAYDA